MLLLMMIVHAQYKWKKKIPASKFGVIINAKGKLKDQDFEGKVFSQAGKSQVRLLIFYTLIFFQKLKKQELSRMESDMKKMFYINLSK